MKRNYNISVFTENKIGLLNRISIIFNRRHINIDSITASDSEIENIHRYTIVIFEEEDLVKKVVKQIEKQVDVFKAFYHNDDEVVYQEIALYKLPLSVSKNGSVLEKILRENYARILTIESDFLIVEKTGHHQEIIKLFELLKPFEILEFARSGKVAISKPIKTLEQYINELN